MNAFRALGTTLDVLSYLVIHSSYVHTALDGRTAVPGPLFGVATHALAYVHISAFDLFTITVLDHVNMTH